MHNSQINLEGKTALILGASRGIGRAIAQAFFDNGANLMLTARSADALEKTAKEIGNGSDRVQYVTMEMKDGDSIANAVNQTVNVFGQLDCAINNAGIQFPPQPFEDFDEDIYDELMAINLRGVSIAVKHELKAMLKNKNGGSIVNVSSALGAVGVPFVAPYVASKHAVIGLTKSVAAEYASRQIRVNALLPGIVKTELFDQGPGATPESLAMVLSKVPMGRVAEPEDITSSVVWLCSDSASYVTGISLLVDGGFAL